MRINLDGIGSAKVLAGSDPLVLDLRIALEDPDGSIVGTLTTRDGLAFFKNAVPTYGYCRLDTWLHQSEMPIRGRLAYSLHSILDVGAFMVEFSVERGCCITLRAFFEPGSDKLKAIQTIEKAWLEYPSLREEEQATVLFGRH